jgi:hypothetical protein
VTSLAPSGQPLSEMDPSHARALTDRIKVAVDGTWLLIQEAYMSRAWAALGYASWDDYCTREFGTSRLRLPREERQEVVSSMREIGMSVRAIASATNQGIGTVHRELAGVPSGTPADHVQGADLDDLDDLDDDDTDDVPPDAFGPAGPQHQPQKVTGTDGKTYATARPVQPQRPALPPQFQAVSAELSRVIARFERLQADDRYRANRGVITTHCLPEIRRAAEVLHALLSDLGHEIGGPL